MASKINSRLKSDKVRSGKPYDRPKQSIFRKVASAVRDVVVPSWLLNIPSWRRSGEEEAVPATTSIETEGITAATLVETEVQDDVTESVSETVVSQPSKRLRYAPDNLETADVSRPRRGMFFPSSAVNDSFSERVGNNTSQVAQSCELEKKEPQLIVNGDDHSENSEGTASTSGCSSLISSHVDKPDHSFSSLKLNEDALESLRTRLGGKGFVRIKKDVGVSTENSFSSTCDRSASQSDLSLWSRDTNLSLRNTLRPQSAFQSSRPSFSVTSFGGPSVANISLSAKEKASPFYEGKTTYGGASAYRRAQLSSLPYQSSRTLRSKITIKPSHSSDDSECMSSAAKRILHTLEKMSTPLTDVKKIPNLKKSPADISASFTPASQRFNSYLPLSRRIPMSTPYSIGPPVTNITSSSRVNLLKNFSKIYKNSKMEIPVHERSTLSLEQTTQSPLPDLELNKGGGGGGGKIRTRINQNLHQSSKANDVKEMPEEVNLPNIPLPITDLPDINFTPKDKPKVTVCDENHRSLTPTETVHFTFANPIDHSPPQTAAQSDTISAPSYTFSSPLIVNDDTTASVSTKLPVEKEKDNKHEEKKEAELYTGSCNDFLKTLRDNNQKSVEKNNSGKENKNCFNTYKVDKELLEPVDAGFGDKLKPESGSWDCTSCLLRNKPDADKCVSCKASKPGSSDKQQSKAFSLGSMFKPPPGSWECPTCLIRNQEDKKKCVACETLKPGSSPAPVEKVTSHIISVGFGDKFKPPPGSWECTSCLVRNKACDNKCISCGSETSNASKDTNKDSELAPPIRKPESEQVDSGKTFKGFSTTETWKCDTCWVSNPITQLKCLACDTPRTASETADPKACSGFKFGVTTPTSSTQFRFGSLVASPVSTTASIAFKFGDTSETSKQQNSVLFGSVTLPATGSTVLPAAPTEGFKFNSPAPVTSTESGGFKFGVPTSDVSLKSSEGLFKCEAPILKSDKDSVSDSSCTPTSYFAFGNGNSNQNKTNDHSKIVTTKTSEVTVHKTETVAKPNILSNVATTIQMPKPSPLFPSETPASITSISKAPCTTATSSALTTGGFIFGGGGSTSSSQTQSTPTFQFGNKTEDIKTSSCATSSAQTTTVFTSTAASGSISSPSPFIFSGQPNKQFGPAEATAVNVSADNHPGMTQKTPVELQSASQISSSNTLSFTPSSAAPQSTNFIFGNTNAPASTSSTSLFKFAPAVTTTSSTTDSTPKSSGLFTFGVPSSTETKDPKPGFSFANTAPEEKTQALPQSQFTFNAFKQDASNPVTTSTSVATASPFRFGATSTPTPASTGGFVFGAPKSDVSQTASSPFTFGSGVATKPLNNSSFGGFAPNQPVTTASVPSFTFGMAASSSAPVTGGFSVPNSNPSSLFTFGAKTTQAAPNPVNNSGALANPNPVFGNPASQSVFSNTSTIPSFGKPPEPKQETPSSFGFGSSTPSQGPVFRFGSTQDGPQEKRHAAAPSPAGGFNFNLPQPSAMNNSMSFNPTAPPSFNFGGTIPAGTPLFQFNASTDPTSGQSSGARKIRKAVRRGVRKPD